MIIKFISFLLLSLLQLFSSTVTHSQILLYYCYMCVQTYIKLTESTGFTHMYVCLRLITSDRLTCQGP